MTATRWLLASLVLVGVSALSADGPGDNDPAKVRPVPPPGVEIPAAARQELQAGVNTSARRSTTSARRSTEAGPARTAARRADLSQRRPLRPDLQRVLRSQTGRHGRKRSSKQGHGTGRGAARRQGALDHGRPASSCAATSPRSTAPCSPTAWSCRRRISADAADKHRLDLWCHGRGEKLTELNFLNDWQKSNAEFMPADAFVLHLYGRYCCANKFAGEIDAFEAMDSVKKHYPIDENRVVVRGFSMGGAACWQFAVHYPSMWCAAAARGRLQRDGRLPQGLPERGRQADVVRAKALAHVRLPPTTPATSSTAPPSPTAARRHAEAGRRHDGGRHEAGRADARPPHRPEHQARLRAGRPGRN